MPNLADVITSANIVGFWEATPENTADYPLAALFPATKQIGTEIAFIKGRGGQPVKPLKPSAYDAMAPIRDRIPGTLVKEEMPFFREGMKISETVRKELNKLKNVTNSYFNEYLKKVYDDNTTLLKGAKAARERMRAQLLSTGSIYFTGEGVTVAIDYGFDTDTQVSEVEGVNQFKYPSQSDPFLVLKNAKKAAKITGDAAAYMTAATFAQIAASESLVKSIVARKVTNITLTDEEIKTYIYTQLKIKIVVLDDVYTNYTFVNESGADTAFFPDNIISLVPMGPLGKTVFGETPEESDLLSDPDYKNKVSITDTGVAVVVKHDYGPPVQFTTHASMACLPSFPSIDFLNIIKTNAGNTVLSVTALPATGKFGIDYTFSADVVGTGSEEAPQYEEGDVYNWNGEGYDKVSE